MIKVQKKDGNLEDYDRKKILLSLIRAGANADQAEKVLSFIETWIKSLDTEYVESSEIRNRILKNLRTINPNAAHGYELYKKQ